VSSFHQRHPSIHEQRQILRNTYRYQHQHHSSSTTTTTSLSLVIGAGAASLIAGSLGGAIGVGVAYPFDTLKTKSQVYGQQRQQQQQQLQEQHHQPSISSVEQQQSSPGVVCMKTHDDDALCYPIESPEEDLISLVKLILEMEGIAGFFGGVKAMMIGQALIKSVAFSANEAALGLLNDFGSVAHNTAVTASVVIESSSSVSGVEDGAIATSFVTLVLAASFSGFVTSFLVAPVGEFSPFNTT
jgi:solute carrier family 25 carnitine/acylcarnitine transporter 20/29